MAHTKRLPAKWVLFGNSEGLLTPRARPVSSKNKEYINGGARMLQFGVPPGSPGKSLREDDRGPPQEGPYLSDAREKAFLATAALCFTSVSPIIEFAMASAEAPPLSAIVSASAALGFAGCLGYGMVTFVASESDLSRASGISGLFSPEGLLFGSYGAIVGGEKGFQLGVDLGATLSDIRGLASNYSDLGLKFDIGDMLKFSMHPDKYAFETYSLKEDLSSLLSDFRKLDTNDEFVSDDSGDLNDFSGSDNSNDGNYLTPEPVSAPDFPSIDPPGYGGSDGDYDNSPDLPPQEPDWPEDW